MKKTSWAFLLSIVSATSQALPTYQPSGPNLTYGAVSNAQTLISNVQNPAAGAVALERGNQYRVGVASSVGGGFEFGQVDNLIDELDALSEALDQDYDSIEAAQAVIDRFDALLVEMGREGYAKVGVGAHVPFFPLVVTHDAFGGSVVLDANGSAQGRLAVLDAPLRYNPQSKELETNSAVYLKWGWIAELSLGYSRPMWRTSAGTLYAGARGRYYQGELSKNVVGVADTSGDTETTFEEEADENALADNTAGLDLGVLWVSEHYRLGATLANINSPSLKYSTIGTDCNGDEGCELARSFADRIALSERHVMDPQWQLEAAIYSRGRNWVLAAGVDANPVRDLVGDELQWATVSVAYATDSWVMPGYRFGYRENLVGSNLSFVTAGFTLFKSMNVDIAYGLEDVTVNDETYPRSVLFNIGLELTF